MKKKTYKRRDEKKRKEFSRQFGLKRRPEIIKELTKEYGYKCWYCGKKFNLDSEIQIDHIVPISDKGENKFSNLALSCVYCNRHKWSHDVTSFLQYLAHIRTGRFECPILHRFERKLDIGDRDALTKSFW